LSQLGTFNNNGELEAAIREWMRIREPNIHGDVKKTKKCINVLTDFVRTK
jgi:hypothetical protein